MISALELQSALAQPTEPPGVHSTACSGMVLPRRPLLCVLQAVNAGGKDGVIQELASVIGEGRFRVQRFRPPGRGEGRVDLLDLANGVAPEANELVFFNRSYYEDALRAALAGRPGIPDECDRIVAFEERLHSQGTAVIKLFLHIDRAEQLRRLEARRRIPELQHLHNVQDAYDQTIWDDLMHAYQTVMTRTHTTTSPWLMIPANERRFRNSSVLEVLTFVHAV